LADRLDSGALYGFFTDKDMRVKQLIKDKVTS